MLLRLVVGAGLFFLGYYIGKEGEKMTRSREELEKHRAKTTKGENAVSKVTVDTADAGEDH